MTTTLESMKELRGFFFEILNSLKAGTVEPRLGRLVVKDRQELETPNFFSIASRGSVPHLTPDVVSAYSQIGGVHMALEDCKFEITTLTCLPSCCYCTDNLQLLKELRLTLHQ